MYSVKKWEERVGNASIGVNEEHCCVIKLILIKELYISLCSLFGSDFF